MKLEDLEFHVLVCLSAAPAGRHGYAVRRWLVSHLGVPVPLQSIYRVIERIHQKHLVECVEGKFADSYAGLPRKTYRLTPVGQEHMAKCATAVTAVVARLTKSLEAYEKVVSHAEFKKQA